MFIYFVLMPWVFSYVSTLIFLNPEIKSYFPFCIFIIDGVYAICGPLFLMLLFTDRWFRFYVLDKIYFISIDSCHHTYISSEGSLRKFLHFTDEKTESQTTELTQVTCNIQQAWDFKLGFFIPLPKFIWSQHTHFEAFSKHLPPLQINNDDYM